MSNFKDEDGKYPSYAWPGGYPIYYQCEDGGVLCPTCANENADLIRDAPKYDDVMWNVIGQEIHWEGSPLICDNCSEEIVSAYGDPEENKHAE